MNRRPLLVSLAAACLALSACASTPRDKDEIGIKKAGLTLAFKDEKLAVPPEVIIQYLPAPEAIARQAVEHPKIPIPVDPAACPPAQGSVDRPAPFAISTPPKPGTYKRINTGTIKVTIGPLSAVVPYPRVTTMVVKNVRTTPGDPPPPVPGAVPGSVTGAVPAVVTVGDVTTFDVVETVSKTFTIFEQYRYDLRSMNLVSRQVHNGDASQSLTPTPAPEIYGFGGLGSSWSGLGVDSRARTSVATNGNVERTEVVNLCGTPFDSVRVPSTTQVVNLRDQTTSGTRTADNKQDILNIAPHLGGLFAVRELHTRDTLRSNNVPVLVDYDVVSVLASQEPVS
jgi:hypothetical protein